MGNSMLTELDDEYWEVSTPSADFGAEKPIAVINGTSVVEQVIAGMIILAIGAAGAHLYDKYSDKYKYVSPDRTIERIPSTKRIAYS